MLQTTVIGNVGADALFQSKDGRDFVTFRVAHNDVWTDQAGQQHSQGSEHCDDTLHLECIPFLYCGLMHMYRSGYIISNVDCFVNTQKVQSVHFFNIQGIMADK